MQTLLHTIILHFSSAKSLLPSLLFSFNIKGYLQTHPTPRQVKIQACECDEKHLSSFHSEGIQQSQSYLQMT